MGKSGPNALWWLANKPDFERMSCPPREERKTEWGHQLQWEGWTHAQTWTPAGGSGTSPRMWPTLPFRRHLKSGYGTLLLISRDGGWEILRVGTRRKIQIAAQCRHRHQLCDPEPTVPILWFSKLEKLRSDLSGWGCHSGSRGPVYYAQGLLLGMKVGG